MPWLPIFQGERQQAWREEAEVRIRFLERFGEQARAVYAQFGYGEGADRRDRSARLAAANALTEAAELALATDQTERAYGFAQYAVEILVDGEPDTWPTIRLALLGALVGRVRTQLRADGFSLGDPRTNRIYRTSWYAPASVVAQTAGSLIAAAAATGSPRSTLSLLWDPPLAEGGDEEGRLRGRLGFLSAMEAPESTVTLLLLPETPRGGRLLDDALAALIAIVARYDRQLRALAINEDFWNASPLSSSLIDWNLLVLLVALYRQQVAIDLTNYVSDGPLAQVARFAQGAANAIARLSQ
jgi:hypothetical protein